MLFDVKTNIDFAKAGTDIQNISSPLQENQYFPYLEYFAFGRIINLDFDINVLYSSLSIQTACSAGISIALRFFKIITQFCTNSSAYFYNDLCYSSCPARTRLITSSSSC